MANGRHKTHNFNRLACCGEMRRNKSMSFAPNTKINAIERLKYLLRVPIDDRVTTVDAETIDCITPRSTRAASARTSMPEQGFWGALSST